MYNLHMYFRSERNNIINIIIEIMILKNAKLLFFSFILVANTYSITILLETYLSMSTRYQDPPGLTFQF